MTILRKIFGDNIPDPHTAIISRWPTDPLFLSAYTAYGPGVPASIFDDLLEPVNERLYFAGEALNSTHYGFTPGGYGSGAHVAKKIIAMLPHISGKLAFIWCMGHIMDTSGHFQVLRIKLPGQYSYNHSFLPDKICIIIYPRYSASFLTSLQN